MGSFVTNIGFQIFPSLDMFSLIRTFLLSQEGPFARLFVPFCCRKKELSLGNEKKNTFFFCISLAYSYLCTRKQN